jgi:hypothetical protein
LASGGGCCGEIAGYELIDGSTKIPASPSILVERFEVFQPHPHAGLNKANKNMKLANIGYLLGYLGGGLALLDYLNLADFIMANSLDGLIALAFFAGATFIGYDNWRR